jgi:xylulokinase
VLEGVAFALREVLEELSRIGPVPNTLNITGGGARSALWRQIVADVLGVPLKYSEADSCLGAAMLAAVGVGEFANIESACDVMKRTQGESHPRQEAVGIYDRLYAEYGRIRDACTVSS